VTDSDLLHAARLVLGAYYEDRDNLALKMLDLGRAVHDMDTTMMPESSAPVLMGPGPFGSGYDGVDALRYQECIRHDTEGPYCGLKWCTFGFCDESRKRRGEA